MTQVPENIKFIILTRTSSRPNYLKLNMESLNKQTHKNWYQLISNDTDSNLDYLEDSNRKVVNVERVERTSYHHFPYNLYLNILNSEAYKMDGWIIYLDDDDMLLDDNSLARLAGYIANKNAINSLFLWRVKYGENFYLPSSKLVKAQKLKANNQPSNSFTFHSSLLNHKNLVWTDVKGGDFKFLCILYRKAGAKIWLDDCFTSVRLYSKSEQGKGMRDDIELFT